MPDAPSSMPPQTPATPEDLEIHTIPDKFYGAALKARIDEKAVAVPPGIHPAKKSHLGIVIVVVVLLAGVGGGFTYFNRGLLFPPPATPIVQAPEPPPPLPLPEPPTDVTATSTNAQSVTVSWTDASDNESGFRIERHGGDGTFIALTSLPQNSASFLDGAVEPTKTYVYRVRALNISGESDPSNEASATVPLPPPPPPVQPTLPPAGLDSDSDGLTDLEENLYGTDAREPDDDLDGFLDGNEVFHLYNPGGPAPVRLLDSALVKVYTGQVGWVMSVPTPWTFTLRVADGTSAMIDTKHGERFVLTIEDNAEKKPILEWYLESHPGVAASQVLQYRSKGGYVGVIGADLLTTYIPWGDRVFVLTYELDDQPFINYRTTYSMMLNSLVLSGLPQTSPPTPGTPLPFEPSATTSGVVTQPVPVEPNATTTSP